MFNIRSNRYGYLEAKRDRQTDRQIDRQRDRQTGGVNWKIGKDIYDLPVWM